MSDWAIVLATFLGPIFAVQAQKWIENRKSVHERRLQIFRVLMATRANRVAPTHVEALNAIQMEYYGKSSPLQNVLEKWKSYMDHFNRTEMDQNIWNTKSDDLFIDLLSCLAQYLGYKFDRVQIMRDVYRPQAHVHLEARQNHVREKIIDLLEGKIVLPLEVRSIAADPKVQSEITELRKLMAAWLRGEAVTKVSTKD